MFHVNAFTINIVNELWGLILSGAGMLILFIYSNDTAKKDPVYNDMRMIILCNSGALLSDLIALTVDGSDFFFSGALVQLSNSILYIFDDFMMILLVVYVHHALGEGHKRRRWYKVVFVVFGLCIFLLILNQFNGCIFYVDEANRYVRGPLFALNQACGLFVELGTLVLVYKCRDSMDRIVRYSFYFYCIFPLMAMILQLVFYGISMFLVATSISVLVMVIGLVQYNAKRLYQREQELIQQSLNAMVSQLQPHFLYNSISSIMGIDGNPPETKKALGYFGKYLRSNLDVIRSSKPVPFSQELQHVEAYVYLEKIRFEDKLEVEYNIGDKNFEVPLLSIQMMVENAIKHGITPKKGKGRVILTTIRHEKYHEIIIEDDGIGFDVHAKPEEGRSHVGLETTYKRIELYGGKLEVDSMVGIGTHVRITIPD